MPMMCQEQNSAMYTGRPSPTSMYHNMGTFGGSYMSNPYHAQTTEYPQFSMDTTGYQNWQNMYATQNMARPQGMEEWGGYSNTHGMPQSTTASTPPASHQYHYAKTMGTPGMGMMDYAPHSSQITVLESPPQHTETSPVSSTSSGSTVSPSNKQMRPDYDWLKPNPTCSSGPAQGKTRTKDKYRVVYSDHQRLELEKEFHFSRYITIRRKAELAEYLKLSERQVKIWFQNRRAKERKQNKKQGIDNPGEEFSDKGSSMLLGMAPNSSVEAMIKQDPGEEYAASCHMTEQPTMSQNSHYPQELSPSGHVPPSVHSPISLPSVKLDPSIEVSSRA